MKQLKCRASQAGKLMTNPQGKSNAEKLFEAKEKLKAYQERLDLAKNKEAKTFVEIREVKIPETLQEIKLLEPIKDLKQLSETAKSFIKEWFISELTGKTKDIRSKYLERGNAMENDAIERVAKYYGVELQKNDVQLENEYFTGTFDCHTIDRVIDTKVPFDAFTFPFFETELDPMYYAQMQIYMNLTGLRKASVCYCLENGSEEQIERLSWQIAKDLGKDEPDIDDWNEAEAQLNYDHLSDHLRIKVFEVEYNETFIAEAQQRVLDARKYIETELLTQIEIQL